MASLMRTPETAWTEIVPDPASRKGVKPYALDPERAKALWAKCEQMVAERF
jgi:hypothetical protein